MRFPARGRATVRAAVLGFSLLGAGCATFELTPPAGDVVVDAVPFNPQARYQCGPAALATVLQYTDVPVSAQELVPRVFLPDRAGSLQAEILAAARAHDRIPYVLPPNADALIAELEAGRPVLVLQNLGTGFLPVWHYAVVTGYLADRKDFRLHSGERRDYLMPQNVFLRTWHRSGAWSMVVLEPGAYPVRPDRQRYLEALVDFESAAGHDAVARAWASAVSRWPGSALTWFGLGNAHYSMGQFEDAVRAFRRAANLEPASAVYLNNLGLALAAAGCHAAAQEAIDRALGVAIGTRFEQPVRETVAEIAKMAPGPGEPVCSNLAD